MRISSVNFGKLLTFLVSRECRGDVAEWLGSGLQSRIPRFESGHHLQLIPRKIRKIELSTRNQDK